MLTFSTQMLSLKILALFLDLSLINSLFRFCVELKIRQAHRLDNEIVYETSIYKTQNRDTFSLYLVTGCLKNKPTFYFQIPIFIIKLYVTM